MKIKSQEELEAFAGKTEEDVIAMKAENAGLKKEVGETRAALEVMNKALQNVLEKTVKGSNLDVPKDKRQQVKDALRAMRKHDLKGVFESGAQSVSPAEVESGIWQPTPWNVGADEKTILGSYYLRGKQIASLIGNGGMNSSQIRGNLNPFDMAIPSQALNEGRCRDLTGAILKRCA